MTLAFLINKAYVNISTKFTNRLYLWLEISYAPFIWILFKVHIATKSLDRIQIYRFKKLLSIVKQL